MGLNTIYTVCAIAGGTVLALRFLLMLFGLDHGDAEVDMDAGLDGGHGAGSVFTFLSIQSISGFFTMFGLVGLGLLQINASDIMSLVGALAAGIFTAWSTGMIFLSMRRLQSEGTLVVGNAVGQTGTVYLTIPETGTGSVSVAVQGSLRNMDAVSEDGHRIPTGSIIKVVGVTAGKILVVTDQITEPK
jgi:hypothetical protein